MTLFPLKKLLLLLSISLHSLSVLFGQTDNVKASHPIYSFLKKMQVQGALKNYDDMIIPFSRNEISSYLSQIDDGRNNLSSSDSEFLDRMKIKLTLDDEDKINVFENFPEEFGYNLTADKEKHLYNYNDSLITFYIDPMVDYKLLNSELPNGNASLLSYGGNLRGSISNWLGFYFEASNGVVWGNRNAARLDKRVEQSFTFNDTKINYFDGTQGYVRFQKDIVSFQLGRERILWGRGYINKMILSNNPPLFDFIKFDLSYRTLKYNFIHAWLVQPKTTFFIDSLSGEGRNKSSKYLAASRLSYTPSTDLSFGISQIIIYANRPFEASYLNPFLLWESAQRSLNDLDNSFISLDSRYKILNGLEVNASVLIDDIHFGELFKNWATIHNRIAWQVGAMVTSPLSFNDLTLKLEYLQIRPYIFIHPGLGESLTYTNNRYMLGYDLSPNSVRLSAELEYRLSGRTNLVVRFDHSIHGNNIYDEKGKIIMNAGGNIYENNDINDSQIAYLLDGNRETTDFLSINFQYEFLYGIYFEAEYQFRKNVYLNNKTSQNIFWGSLALNF